MIEFLSQDASKILVNVEKLSNSKKNLQSSMVIEVLWKKTVLGSCE